MNGMSEMSGREVNCTQRAHNLPTNHLHRDPPESNHGQLTRVHHRTRLA